MVFWEIFKEILFPNIIINKNIYFYKVNKQIEISHITQKN